MLKELTRAAQQCPKDVQQHNRRTGQIIRALLIEAGRGELVELWRLEQNGPCDYHDIGKGSGDSDPLAHCSPVFLRLRGSAGRQRTHFLQHRL